MMNIPGGPACTCHALRDIKTSANGIKYTLHLPMCDRYSYACGVLRTYINAAPSHTPPDFSLWTRDVLRKNGGGCIRFGKPHLVLHNRTSAVSRLGGPALRWWWIQRGDKRTGRYQWPSDHLYEDARRNRLKLSAADLEW